VNQSQGCDKPLWCFVGRYAIYLEAFCFVFSRNILGRWLLRAGSQDEDSKNSGTIGSFWFSNKWYPSSVWFEIAFPVKYWSAVA
jgi:hypothetical protein